MSFPATVDTIVDGTTTAHASQALGPQRITVGPTMYNVLSDTTGPADPSGATDSSTAIANAIAAMSSGGELYFPQGTYLAAGLTLNSNAHWRAPGDGATILKLLSSAPTTTPLVQSANFASLTGTNSTGGVTNCSISGLTLDGNKGAIASTVPVIRLYGYGYHLLNVRIRNGNNKGLYSEWSTSAPTPGADSMEAHLFGLKVHDCGSDGVHWNGPHDSDVVNLESYLNGGRGIFVDAAGNGTKFLNAHSWGLTQTYAWYIGATGVALVNFVAEGAITAQVAVNANDCQLVAGNVFASGGGTTGIIIGDTGTVTGTIVLAKVMNCTTAGINFKNDGQSYVAADIFQTSGSPTTGTISINTYLQLLVNGVAGSVYRFPAGVEIHGGSALKLYSAADASFATVAFNGGQVTSTWPIQTAAGTAIQAGAGVQPGTPAGALQTGNLFMGTGAPSNSNGNNGDFYLRTDGTEAGHTLLYHKESGSWVVSTGA